MMTTRRRALAFTQPGASWTGVQWVNSNPNNRTPIKGSVGPSKPALLQGTQVTESENHSGWNRRRSAEFHGDIGGPFSTVIRKTTLTGGQHVLSGKIRNSGGFLNRDITYNGTILPNLPVGTTFPPHVYSSNSELNALGVQAIASCKPTNIFVDLSASLGELLREGFPKLGAQVWESATKAARDVSLESVTDAAKHAAGGHLSLEFGFKPIVNDIRNSLIALERADAAIQQYVRDSGKMVRRQFSFPDQESETTSIVASGVTPITRYSDDITASFFSPGALHKTRITSVRRWFSGAFTYHLPLDDSLEEMSAAAVRARGLISLDVTPETLWNLAPWSWAVDWFVPVDDYISYLQDQSTDGLVLRYGYLMEHAVCSDTYRWVGKNSQLVGVYTLTSERKTRIRANPFGFGLSWSDLSPRQLSIAAALGISRS